jgi:hypothetical protein
VQPFVRESYCIPNSRGILKLLAFGNHRYVGIDKPAEPHIWY